MELECTAVRNTIVCLFVCLCGVFVMLCYCIRVGFSATKEYVPLMESTLI